MTDQSNDPGSRPTKASEIEPKIYDVEPVDPKPPAAKITEAPLLDDFDEDADFDKDPAVAATLKPAQGQPAQAESIDPPFIKTGRGDPRAIAMAGLGVALLAAILNGWLGDVEWYKSFVLSLYRSGLFATAGVLAAVFAARMSEQPTGQIELAAARMLLIVATCQAILACEIPIPYTGRVDEVVIAALAYAGLSGFFFRLPRESWLIMSIGHFLLIVLLWIGSRIEIWAAAVALVKSH